MPAASIGGSSSAIGAHRRGIAGVVANPLTIALKDLGLWGCSSHEKFIPRVHATRQACRAARAAARVCSIPMGGWRIGARSASRPSSRRLAQRRGRTGALARRLVLSAEKQPHFAYLTASAGRVDWSYVLHDQPSRSGLAVPAVATSRLRAAGARGVAKMPSVRRDRADERSRAEPVHLGQPSDRAVHHRRLCRDAQHRAGAEYRRARRARPQETGRRVLDGNGRDAARAADDRLRRPARPAQASHRPPRPGRLGEAVDGARTLNEAPILIDETPALNAIEVRSRARRIMKQHGELGLVIVDYLQLMQSSSQGENRATEISEISRSMKALAKELKVPVVALSQLNRSLEQRPNKRPVMSDLRECVTGDTLVVTTDGARVPIRDLVGQTPSVLGCRRTAEDRRRHAELVWSKGVKPVFHVSRSRAGGYSGRRPSTGSSQRRVGSESRSLPSARALRLPVASRRRARRRHGTSTNSCCLGHLVGDGSYPDAPAAALHDGIGGKQRRGPRCRGGDGQRRQALRRPRQLASARDSRQRESLASGGASSGSRISAFTGSVRTTSSLPAEVFRSGQTSIATLLRHLWATDGSISLRKPGTEGASRVYLQHVQRAACRRCRGAPAALGHRRADSGVRMKTRIRPVYSVDVSGARSNCCFLDTVGAFGPRVAPAHRVARALRSDGRQYECRHAADRGVRRA